MSTHEWVVSVDRLVGALASLAEELAEIEHDDLDRWIDLTKVTEMVYGVGDGSPS